MQTIDGEDYRIVAEAGCTECGRFFREELTRDKRGFSILNVNCPHCGTLSTATVHKILSGHHRFRSVSISGGKPEYAGYPLYFVTSYDGKPIWAINPTHLQYLIDYIGADLREKPDNRGLSYNLPKFMKSAKNRDGILKALYKLQKK